MASAGLPLIIDTGRSTKTRSAWAVGWARASRLEGADQYRAQPHPDRPPAGFTHHLTMRCPLVKSTIAFDGSLSITSWAIDMMPFVLRTGARADVSRKASA